MTTKHTPGPWTIHKDYSRANYTVFDADGNYGDTSVETIDANAALIAAAPDLLVCLKEYALPALNYLSIKAMSASDRAEFKNREIKVRAAISKATASEE